ncbi:MAG: EF-P lysine aminoacylase EpmA [Candidatus Gottesmanbacteria bacterium]|nr:EF-P lysine aminoacylase EpmA [Candidatus Gottesmanbacteria bacterium]
MKTWRRLKEHPELWERYFVREKVIRATRSFFEKEKFHEIETPILIAHPPAESYLDVFETKLLDRKRRVTPAYLSTSPEVPLKKLMAAGLGNCYAITKSFRNMETDSHLHNPEFTILEWYRTGADYFDIMNDCEKLLIAIAGGTSLTYQGQKINLTVPWERITVADAFKKYAGVNFDDFFSIKNAKKIIRQKGYTVEENTTWEQLYNQIFLNEVEPHLGHGKPTIVYEFPGELAALAKKKESDPRVAERFEFYIEGLELGDAYSELTDPVEQEARFKKELAELKRLGKTTYDYDHDFIDALKVGLPKCSGIAVGIDRLVMLLADTTDIADTLFFPAKEEFPLPEKP